MCQHPVRASGIRGRLLFWRRYWICALCDHREREPLPPGHHRGHHALPGAL